MKDFGHSCSQEIINNYMIKAMGEVGQRFQDGKAFVPQLLMAGRAMKDYAFRQRSKRTVRLRKISLG